jgi:hypothetical protein
MKLIVKNQSIDFEAPVYMSEDQRDKFIDFIKKTFENVEVREVQEESRPGPHGGTPRKWTAEDIAVLLEGSSIKKKAEKLDRSEMSVIMRTGSIVPEITKWMKKKGCVEYPPAKEIIEEFMKEVGML